MFENLPPLGYKENTEGNLYVSLCVCNPSCEGTLLPLEYDEFSPILTAIKSGLSGTAVEIRQLELRVLNMII